MSRYLNILIFEGVKNDALLIEHQLKKASFKYKTKLVDTKTDFIDALNTFYPDLILSDYNFHNISGTEVLKITKKKVPNTPIIIVTKHLNEKDAIKLIKKGAWDYVLKDNYLRLIPAIINALKLQKEHFKLQITLETLNEAKNKYKDLYENAPNMYLTIDFKTARIVQCNETLENKIKYSKLEIINHSIFDFTTNETIAKIKQELVPNILNSKETIENLDVDLIKKGGEIIHTLMNVKLKFRRDGLISFLNIVLIDVSKRVKNEKVLKKQKDMFEVLSEEYHTQNDNLHYTIKQLAVSKKELKNKLDIINRSPAISFAWKNENGWPVKYVSENVEQILGYTLEDFMYGKIKYADIIHPEDIERVKKEVANKTSNHLYINKFTHKPYRVITKNNKIKWVNDDTIIIRKNNKITHYEGIVSDITKKIKVQQALKLSEKKYRKMLDANSDIIVIRDIEYNIVYMNTAAIKKYGKFKKNTKCYKHIFEQEDICSWCIKLNREKSKPIQKEIYFPKNKRQYIATANKMKEVDGSIQFMYIYKDVTELREAQNERLKLLKTLESGLNEIYIFDDKTQKFIYANKRATDNLGYNLKEIFKLSPLSIKPELTEKAFNNLLKPLKTGKTKNVRFETVHLRKNGTKYPVDVSLQVYEQGETESFLAVINDISERLEKEETIKKLSTAISQSPVIVIITDVKGNIEFVNPKFEEVTGYSLKEVIGKKTSVLKSGNQDLKFYKNLWNTLSKGKTWNGEFLNKKKNGELYWEESIISPVKNISGNITHYIAIKDDVTEKKAIKEKLIQSELHFRKLFENSLIGMYLTTPTGKIIRANKALCKMLKFETFESLSKHISKEQKLNPFNREPFKNILENQSWVQGFESVWKTKDGENIYVRENARRYVDEKGDVFYEGTVENITDYKLADIALKKASSFNKKIIKIGKLGYAIYSKEGKCLWVNQSYLDIIGATKDQIYLRNFKDIDNWKKTELLSKAKICLNTGKKFKKIINSESSFNKNIWVEINFSRIKEHEDYKLLVIIKDISSFMRAKYKQYQTKIEYVNLISNVNTPIFGINMNAQINEWNKTIEQLTGFRRRETKGKNLKNFIYDKNDPNFKMFLSNALNGVETSNVEIQLKTKNNKNLKLLISTTTRRDVNYKIDGIVCIGQDITKIQNYQIELEKQVEKRTHDLIQALKKEKELGDLKSQFVSMASHEFRTPLTTISLASGFIKKYWNEIDEDKRNIKLDKIDTQVKHMTSLLEDVLTLGKTEAGKIKFEPKKTNLIDFLKIIIEELESNTKNKHKIKFSFDNDLCFIMLDQKIGRNIFVNLLTNAMKFSPNSNYININVYTLKDSCKIEVIDKGVGIPENEKEHIFTPFHRGKNVHTIQGTGLGLAIVKESVELLKGNVEVESELKKGTKFSINLPKLL